MNWLAIARRIARESGISATDTTPASVVGQSGEMLSVVNWCGDAWLAIEAKKLWGWLWENPDLTLTAGTYLIDADVSAHRYVLDSMRDSTGAELSYLKWDDFRISYPAAAIGDGIPGVWTVRPDRKVAFNARPATDITFSVERYRNPTAMPAGDGADAQTPDMPEHQHMAIVWRAVMFYAGHDEAGNLYQHAKAEYDRIMGESSIDDLPDYEPGDPLC